MMLWLIWLGFIASQAVLWRFAWRSIRAAASAADAQESLAGMSRRYDDLRRELALLAWAEATTGTNEAAICRARDISLELAVLRSEFQRRAQGRST